MLRTPRKMFSADEKRLIVNYIKNHKDVIENKNNDMKLIKEKKAKWEELSHIFAIKGYDRDPQRLREYYHRMKCNAKNTIRTYQKHIKNHGTIPNQTPSEFDWCIYEIAPIDFVDENDVDNSLEEKETDNSNNSLDDNHTIIKLEVINENDVKATEIETTSQKGRKRKRKDDDLPPEMNAELLNYKKQLELEYHNERLRLLQEKHAQEMENINLLQKKLKMELDAATVTKLKMERESEKISKEILLIQQQMITSKEDE